MKVASRFISIALSIFGPILLGQESSSFFLPKPTGPYAVGRTILWWTDQSRREAALSSVDVRRELVAFVYYPADATGVNADYYPGLTGLGPVPETKILEKHFGSAWSAVAAGRVRSRAYADAPFSKEAGLCPVLVFSPGGSAPLAIYSIQLEELASYGYVVVGLEHPYDTALIIRPDHRLIPFVDQNPHPAAPTAAWLRASIKQVVRWAADTRFALDEIATSLRRQDTQFFGHLDLSRVGVFGHSLGGMAAARLCQADSRIGACMNQDGEMFGIPFGGTEPISSLNTEQPTMAPFVDIYAAEQLATDAQLAAVHVTRAQFESWRNSKTEALRAFLRRNTRASYLVVVKRPEFTHGTFMDIAQLDANIAGNDASQARSNLEVATRLTRAFFDATLKRQHESWDGFLQRPPSGITVERYGNQHTQ
jgi:predicted dienelactone hydrolase